MTVAHKLRQNKSPVKKQDRASETTRQLELSIAAERNLVVIIR